MLYNATLLRIDPPSPAEPGPPISVRCTICDPSAAQTEVMSSDATLASSASTAIMLYVRLDDLGPLAYPLVNGFVQVREDGQLEERYQVLQVSERIGTSLSHLEITVVPAP